MNEALTIELMMIAFQASCRY